MHVHLSLINLSMDWSFYSLYNEPNIVEDIKT